MFFIPRFIATWLAAINCMIVCALITLGHNKSERLGPVRQKMCAIVVAITARTMLTCYGVPWISKKKVLSDYSKWFGPEWKLNPATSFTGASTYVSNH